MTHQSRLRDRTPNFRVWNMDSTEEISGWLALNRPQKRFCSLLQNNRLIVTCWLVQCDYF